MNTTTTTPTIVIPNHQHDPACHIGCTAALGTWVSKLQSESLEIYQSSTALQGKLQKHLREGITYSFFPVCFHLYFSHFLFSSDPEMLLESIEDGTCPCCLRGITPQEGEQICGSDLFYYSPDQEAEREKSKLNKQLNKIAKAEARKIKKNKEFIASMYSRSYLHACTVMLTLL
jgi:hypothetical protein